MKKFVLLLLTILLPNLCFAVNEIEVQTKNNSGYISNRRGLITQVLKNGALGYICPKWSPFTNDCLYGTFVYFDINFNNDAIDYQRFTIPKGYSMYANGKYTYKEKRYQERTIRKIELRKKDKNNKEKKISLFKL